MSTERKDRPNTFKPEEFPFDRLRLGTVGSFGWNKNDQFGTTHLQTYLANKETGKLEAYFIKLPTLTGGPISYYLPKDENTGLPKPGAAPSLYLRQNLHAQWSKPNPDGSVSRTRLPRGIVLEEFWKKFHAKMMEFLRALPQDDLVQLMGLRKLQQLDICLPELCQFGTYDDKHAKRGLPNEERSEQFKSSGWTQERGRMKKETLAKIEKLRPEEMLIIPGTDVHVYTAYYDNTPDSPCPGKRILGDWSPMKRFCYNKDRLENASYQYAEIMAYQVLQGPCLCFNPKKNLDGEIQCQQEEVVFTGYNARTRDGAFTEEQLANEKRRRQEDADELGFDLSGAIALPNEPIEQPVRKHIKQNDGSVTAVENRNYHTNDPDDDITALGLQSEYDASRGEY